MEHGWSVVKIGNRVGLVFNCLRRGQVFFTVSERMFSWNLVRVRGLGSWRRGEQLPGKPPARIRRAIRELIW